MRAGVVTLTLCFCVLLGCHFDGVAGSGERPDPMADAAPTSNDDAATISDSDGDGVDDASDNCASTANPGQHDEDRDGAGDACDNCPHLANLDQADEDDGDGVGDACDPHQARRDAFVFDGFNGEIGGPAWTLGAGWTIAGGELRKDDTSVESTATIAVPGFAGEGRAIARLAVTATDADGALSIAALTGPANLALGDGSGCGLLVFHDTGARAMAAFHYDVVGWQLADQAMAWTVGAAYTMTADRDSSGLSCAAGGVVSQRPGAATGDDIGLYSYRSAVRAEWIIAFRPQSP